MVLAYVSEIKKYKPYNASSSAKNDVKFVQLDLAEHNLANVPRPETDNRVS
jgi:hypothetical protein